MPKWLRRLFGSSAPVRAPLVLEIAETEAKPVAPASPPRAKISDTVVSLSKRGAPTAAAEVMTFKAAEPPPGVLPKSETLAFDEQIIETSAWAAGQFIDGSIANGVTFIGYPELSAMAQRPEYRRISEVLATEATRKWVKLQSKTDTVASRGTRVADPKKAERIAELTAEMKRLDLEGAFRKMIELDGFFGRAHLYLDTGDTEKRDELTTTIGDGRNAATLNKFGTAKGFLKAVKPIEPVWCYPAKYNATDPLKPDWYNPQSWFVQGKEIHSTRLLTFVGREVPDLLKPAYSFGGLSLTQMAKPYVDNWLRTRQAIADLIWTFSVRIIKTDLSTSMAQDGEQLFKRIAVMANLQTNQGILALDKDKEDFANVTTPLGSLDALQSQAMEQMCLPSATPVTKFFGSQPAGLNASSQGELEVWYDHVEAFQKKFIAPHLHEVLGFTMLSLWGEIDEDITAEFIELRSQTEKEEAETRKTDAETDIGYIEAGVLSPAEVRARLASDPDSPYDGIDADELPDIDLGEEDDGAPEGSPVGSLTAGLNPRADRSRDDRTRERADRGPDDADRGARREDRARERV